MAWRASWLVVLAMEILSTVAMIELGKMAEGEAVGEGVGEGVAPGAELVVEGVGESEPEGRLLMEAEG